MSSEVAQINKHQYVLFVQRIGLAGIAQTIRGLKGLIILPILTKTLGESDYGIWALVITAILLLGPLLELGLAGATVRFLSSKGKREVVQGITTVLSITLVPGSIVSLLLFLLSDFLATSILGDTSAASVIKIASPIVILEVLNLIALGSFRIFGQIKRYALVIVSGTLLEVGLIAFFVLSGHGLVGAMLAFLIARAAVLLVTLGLIFHHAGFAFPDHSLLRHYLAFGLPTVAAGMSLVALNASDRYVIVAYLGTAPVGIYSAAYAIGGITFTFVGYVAFILAPTIFSLYDSGRINEAKTYLAYSWRYLLMLSIPAAFGLFVLTEPLLKKLTTAEFVSEGRFIVPLVALGGVCFGVYVMFAQVVRLFKRTGILFLASGVAASMNLGLNVVIVPHWGIIGAGVTTLLSYTTMAAIVGYFSVKFMKYDTGLGFIIKSIFSSVVMAGAIWAINHICMENVVLSVVIGIIVYFAILFLVRGINRTEVQFILLLLKETARAVRK
ncbi:MAG: oligosaccharide flippase family protein [Planctomycetes bacterium]|nr:oligosaccharide flippase family protein [Planctomycetota bacterium]